MQKSREQLEVNCRSIKGGVRVSAAAATAAEASRRNPGTKSKLAFCVCSDVKFCHILVPLPPLAASVSQRIRASKQLCERCVCASLPFTRRGSLDRPAVVSVHSGINYYCLKSSTPVDRLSVGTALSVW